ncbi:MAG: hypothetical protein OXG35_05730 [Acidobacteria bacterium]|nr:hypothetical protein [Acidobacteriota bacterium]
MARFSGVTAQGRGRSKSGRRGDVRPGGVRTQRYGESVRDMRGARTDVLEEEREVLSAALDERDQVDGAIQSDDPDLPQARRRRTHGDLLYEVALCVETRARVERGESGPPRRSPPSMWVRDSRLFGYVDPVVDRRRRALEADGAVREEQIREAFRARGRGSGEEFWEQLLAACDSRDLGDAGGLNARAAREVGRVRYVAVDDALVGANADPCLLVAASGLLHGGDDPESASDAQRFAGRVLDRALEGVCQKHALLCVSDPGRAASIERRWEAGRERLGVEGIPDVEGGRLTAWFERSRFVAQAHYAVGLDPVSQVLPQEDIDRVVEAFPSLNGAVGALGVPVGVPGPHVVARSVREGFGAVRALDPWLVDQGTVGRVMGEALERVGGRWPVPGREELVERAGGGYADVAPVRPAGPTVDVPGTGVVARAYVRDERPFDGSRWPVEWPSGDALGAQQALMVDRWRRDSGAGAWERRSGCYVREPAAVRAGGEVGGSVCGVRVPAGRGETVDLFPVESVGLGDVKRPVHEVFGQDHAEEAVDRVVAGLGVVVSMGAGSDAAYDGSKDELMVPGYSPGPAEYVSAVALALAAATGHRLREGRKDFGAAEGSRGEAREAVRCDLAAAKLAGAIGVPYGAARRLPELAGEVFREESLALCRDADRMASFLVARARGVELEPEYRERWRGEVVGRDVAERGVAQER